MAVLPYTRTFRSFFTSIVSYFICPDLQAFTSSAFVAIWPLPKMWMKSLARFFSENAQSSFLTASMYSSSSFSTACSTLPPPAGFAFSFFSLVWLSVRQGSSSKGNPIISIRRIPFIVLSFLFSWDPVGSIALGEAQYVVTIRVSMGRVLSRRGVAGAVGLCHNAALRGVPLRGTGRFRPSRLNVKGNEIRRTFVDFFARHGHRVLRSSSLVPVGDPTLLFTNAGMNQFKDVFLGLDQRDYKRAVTVQKCVRAGGKHNDLENVGRTTRHHTFFEMLGNFSFGDYFKKEAIAFAWELVTKEWRIPPEKLCATIFKGEEGIPRDAEAYQHWLEQGVPKERIFEFGSKDNFWAMGDTGPCGPCSEIHYDMGPAASDEGHTDCAFGCDCGRYVEIWNLVFMQFNRDASGTMNPLPKPSIDTGAGLERLATVLQGKISNFDTDLFRPLIEEAAALAKTEYGANHDTDVSLRIIADHARAATFLISDGVLPSNEGREYVLRLILRRALYHGQTLGLNAPFMFKLSGEVVEMMKGAYPEIAETEHHVAKVVLAEERRFAHTLDIGLKKLDELIGEALHAKDNQTPPVAILPGEKAFMLYDTYGLPRDFIEDACRDQGIQFNGAEFDRAMEAQRERAKASWKG